MKSLITALTDLASRMNAVQLLMAGLSILASVILIAVILWKCFLAFIARFSKPKSFKKEQNRFKREIAKDQEDGDLIDGVKGLFLIIAITIVIVAFSHGR